MALRPSLREAAICGNLLRNAAQRLGSGAVLCCARANTCHHESVLKTIQYRTASSVSSVKKKSSRALGPRKGKPTAQDPEDTSVSVPLHLLPQCLVVSAPDVTHLILEDTSQPDHQAVAEDDALLPKLGEDDAVQASDVPHTNLYPMLDDLDRNRALLMELLEQKKGIVGCVFPPPVRHKRALESFLVDLEKSGCLNQDDVVRYRSLLKKIMLEINGMSTPALLQLSRLLVSHTTAFTSSPESDRLRNISQLLAFRLVSQTAPQSHVLSPSDYTLLLECMTALCAIPRDPQWKFETRLVEDLLKPCPQALQDNSVPTELVMKFLLTVLPFVEYRHSPDPDSALERAVDALLESYSGMDVETCLQVGDLCDLSANYAALFTSRPSFIKIVPPLESVTSREDADRIVRLLMKVSEVALWDKVLIPAEFINMVSPDHLQHFGDILFQIGRMPRSALSSLVQRLRYDDVNGINVHSAMLFIRMLDKLGVRNQEVYSRLLSLTDISAVVDFSITEPKSSVTSAIRRRLYGPSYGGSSRIPVVSEFWALFARTTRRRSKAILESSSSSMDMADMWLAACEADLPSVKASLFTWALYQDNTGLMVDGQKVLDSMDYATLVREGCIAESKFNCRRLVEVALSGETRPFYSALALASHVWCEHQDPLILHTIDQFLRTQHFRRRRQALELVSVLPIPDLAAIARVVAQLCLELKPPHILHVNTRFYACETLEVLCTGLDMRYVSSLYVETGVSRLTQTVHTMLAATSDYAAESGLKAVEVRARKFLEKYTALTATAPDGDAMSHILSFLARDGQYAASYLVLEGLLVKSEGAGLFDGDIAALEKCFQVALVDTSQRKVERLGHRYLRLLEKHVLNRPSAIASLKPSLLILEKFGVVSRSLFAALELAVLEGSVPAVAMVNICTHSNGYNISKWLMPTVVQQLLIDNAAHQLTAEHMLCLANNMAVFTADRELVLKVAEYALDTFTKEMYYYEEVLGANIVAQLLGLMYRLQLPPVRYESLVRYLGNIPDWYTLSCSPQDCIKHFVNPALKCMAWREGKPQLYDHWFDVFSLKHGHCLQAMMTNLSRMKEQDNRRLHAAYNAVITSLGELAHTSVVGLLCGHPVRFPYAADANADVLPELFKQLLAHNPQEFCYTLVVLAACSLLDTPYHSGQYSYLTEALNTIFSLDELLTAEQMALLDLPLFLFKMTALCQRRMQLKLSAERNEDSASRPPWPYVAVASDLPASETEKSRSIELGSFPTLFQGKRLRQSGNMTHFYQLRQALYSFFLKDGFVRQFPGSECSTAICALSALDANHIPLPAPPQGDEMLEFGRLPSWQEEACYLVAWIVQTAPASDNPASLERYAIEELTNQALTRYLSSMNAIIVEVPRDVLPSNPGFMQNSSAFRVSYVAQQRLRARFLEAFDKWQATHGRQPIKIFHELPDVLEPVDKHLEWVAA